MTNKVTIRDVARRAGVSVGTASRAMNAVPGVQARTKDAVHEAARDLGYQPNAAARALRSRSSRLIGCLFSDLENPLYTRLFNALQEQWADEGFVTLISANSNRLDHELRALATFAERGLDAIVIAPGHETDPALIDTLRAFPAPIFVLDRDVAIAADRLLFDHAAAMRQAVLHLAELGHRAILPVFTRGPTRPGTVRGAAFDAALREAGLVPGPRIEPEAPNALVFDQVSAVLAGPDRPTAMVVQGTRVLSSTLNAVTHAGLRMPDDISLVAIGDSPTTEDHVPPITALRLDREALVDIVGRRVLDRIRGQGDPAPIAPEIGYDLVVRASTGAPPDEVRTL